MPEMIIYYMKVQKNNRSGVLAVFSKNNGEVYKSLFEDRSELKKQTNGLIQIYTAKNFFVVDFNFEKQSIDDTTIEMQINKVGNLATGAPRLKGGAEFPNPEDGFWQCTSNCYDYIKQECDGWCGFFCDMTDNYYYTCSIGQMAGCAAFCF